MAEINSPRRRRIRRGAATVSTAIKKQLSQKVNKVLALQAQIGEDTAAMKVLCGEIEEVMVTSSLVQHSTPRGVANMVTPAGKASSYIPPAKFSALVSTDEFMATVSVPIGAAKKVLSEKEIDKIKVTTPAVTKDPVLKVTAK